MTAYAPLLARYRFTQWKAANLIWFDHKTVVRTPNYYVQQMFSRNKGDVYLKNEAEFSAGQEDRRTASQTRIGLGTWSTQAVYDDLQIEAAGRLVVKEDFGSTPQWKVINGRFEEHNGTYCQIDKNSTPAMAITPTTVDGPNAVISVRAKKTGGSEGFLVMVQDPVDESYYWLNLGGWGNTAHAIERGYGDFSNGREIVSQCRGSIENDVWYDIRIETIDGTVRCFLNDQQILQASPPRSEVGVAASLDQASEDVIVKIANPTADAIAATIDLQGDEPRSSSGELTLLTGSRSAFNSLEQPRKIEPVVREIKVGAMFDYTIPPFSVQFIRIPRDP